MLRRLLPSLLPLVMSACDAGGVDPDTVFAAPEAVVEAFPYPIDLDGDGADDVALAWEMICTADRPTSGCSESVGLRKETYGEPQREIDFLRLNGPLAEGDSVGPYPEFGPGPSTGPVWSPYTSPAVAWVSHDYTAGTAQPSEPVERRLFGFRFRMGERERYGWVRLSGRAERYRSEGTYGWRLIAVVHAYALGAGGQPVRAGERP